MAIKALVFDLYGTIINIETNEEMDELYRTISHFLIYWGIDMKRQEVKELYFSIMKRQRAKSPETYPEIDVEAIWTEFLLEKKVRYLEDRKEVARFAKELGHLYRAVSRVRLETYENVHKVLDHLKVHFPLAMVSDAQPCFSIEELRAVGLHGYFAPLIISGHYGYRKPDPRLFHMVLKALHIEPHEAIFIGNDMFRDIHGASQVGMKTIFFASNQGQQEYPATAPDYYVNQFSDILHGVEHIVKHCECHA